MASLNKVILIGRLGKDPEITTFESGNRKMSVTLATTERYRDRDNNWVDQTEWHNLVPGATWPTTLLRSAATMPKAT